MKKRQPWEEWDGCSEVDAKDGIRAMEYLIPRILRRNIEEQAYRALTGAPPRVEKVIQGERLDDQPNEVPRLEDRR